MCQTVPDQVDEIVNLKKCTLVGHLPVHKSRRVRVQLRLANSKASNEPEMQQRQREDVGPDLTLSPAQMSESETSEMQQRRVGWLNILSLLHFPNSHQLLRITSQK